MSRVFTICTLLIFIFLEISCKQVKMTADISKQIQKPVYVDSKGDTIITDEITIKFNLTSNTDFHVVIDKLQFMYDPKDEINLKYISKNEFFHFKNYLSVDSDRSGIFIVENKEKKFALYPHKSSFGIQSENTSIYRPPLIYVNKESNEFEAKFERPFLRINREDSIIKIHYLFKDSISNRVFTYSTNWINIGDPGFMEWSLKQLKLLEQALDQTDSNFIDGNYFLKLIGSPISCDLFT